VGFVVGGMQGPSECLMMMTSSYNDKEPNNRAVS